MEKELQEFQDDNMSLDQYLNLIDSIENDALEEHQVAVQKYDEDAIKEDLRIIHELERVEQQRKQSFYSKRSAKQSKAQRGGVRQQSPFFDDD